MVLVFDKTWTVLGLFTAALSPDDILILTDQRAPLNLFTLDRNANAALTLQKQHNGSDPTQQTFQRQSEV